MAAGTDCCRGAHEAGHQGRQQQLRLQHARQCGMRRGAARTTAAARRAGQLPKAIVLESQGRASCGCRLQQRAEANTVSNSRAAAVGPCTLCHSWLRTVPESQGRACVIDTGSGLEQPTGATARSCLLGPAHCAPTCWAVGDMACCLWVCTSIAAVV